MADEKGAARIQFSLSKELSAGELAEAKKSIAVQQAPEGHFLFPSKEELNKFKEKFNIA